jgi:hypothetical protein
MDFQKFLPNFSFYSAFFFTGETVMKLGIVATVATLQSLSAFFGRKYTSFEKIKAIH